MANIFGILGSSATHWYQEVTWTLHFFEQHRINSPWISRHCGKKKTKKKIKHLSLTLIDHISRLFGTRRISYYILTKKNQSWWSSLREKGSLRDQSWGNRNQQRFQFRRKNIDEKRKSMLLWNSSSPSLGIYDIPWGTGLARRAYLALGNKLDDELLAWKECAEIPENARNYPEMMQRVRKISKESVKEGTKSRKKRTVK